MDKLDKVRLAIVGCGTISQLNAPGYLRHERCEVAVLCDPLRERAEQRAKQWGISPRIYTSYEEVLNDSQVDAVELLTPTFLHPEQIIAGLDAGKHVSCQKPISVSIAETDEITKAVKRAKTRFRITENFVYYPPIVKAKQLLEAGAIGEPSMLRIRTIRGRYGDSPAGGFSIGPDAGVWRRDPNRNAGGALYDDGWHKYATAMWWLGEVEQVYSIVTRTGDFVSETPSAAMWRFKGKDCLGVLDYSAAPQMPIRTRYYPSDEFFEIIGEQGAIWVTRCTGELLDMPPVMVVKGSETMSYQVPMDWIEGFNGAANDFIDSILEDRQPDLDVYFSRK
ncbi:MAG: Gfo/Idh/MocA family protein, partial [Ardenticatenaceae bacterium]